VIPLYRDDEAKQPNITTGLLEELGKQYGAKPNARDIAAYIYAALGGQSYTQRFWNELETPGPRVPLTKDGKIFTAAVSLGERLLWLHTYAERFREKERGDEIPTGLAKSIKGISSDPTKYPESYSYEETTREIRVGDGCFGPVDLHVWEFEVSGLKVVQLWLGYRMKKRAGKRSSALDDIRPDHWTPQMTDEFLELLWVLEATLSMEPELSAMLDKIAAGPCFNAADLPIPTEAQREAPVLAGATGDLLEIMEVDGHEVDGEDEQNA
jgi:hypothetical protein